MMKFGLLLLTTLICYLPFGNIVAQEESAIYMVSTDGDAIGQGKTFVFDESVGAIDLWPIKLANSKNPCGFSLIFYHGKEESWQFKFTVPAQTIPTMGKTYHFAEAYPYQQSHKPGIKVCPIYQDYNNLNGQFTLLDYALDPKGSIASLAIDFKQTAKNKGALNGSIRYNSSIPLKTDFDKPVEDESDHYYENQNSFVYYSEEGYAACGVKEHQSNDLFTATSVYGNQNYLGFNKNYISYDQVYWHMEFAAPNGEKIGKGVYYDAKRFPFYPSGPQMALGIKSCGCNQSFGNFEVLDISYEPSGALESAAIDFVRHCESATAPPVRGSLRYKSNIPPSTKEQIKAKLG